MKCLVLTGISRRIIEDLIRRVVRTIELRSAHNIATALKADIGDADSDYIVYRDNANWERVCDNAAPPDNWDASTLEPWNKGYWICVLRGG